MRAVVVQPVATTRPETVHGRETERRRTGKKAGTATAGTATAGRTISGLAGLTGLPEARDSPATSPGFLGDSRPGRSRCASRAAVPKRLHPVNPANPAIVFPAVAVVVGPRRWPR